jgi:hypothetical protein
MVCKKNTNDLYWFRLKNALHLVQERSLILSCTEVLVVGVTSGREGGAPGSQNERSECFMSGIGVFVFCRPHEMVPTFPFYICKGSIGLQACAT